MDNNIKPINCGNKIMQQNIGVNKVPVGGGEGFAFHFFEAPQQVKPVLALEIWDIYPDQWADNCLSSYNKQALNSPEQWALEAIKAGAQAVNLELKSIDPNGLNGPPERAAQVIEGVLAAIDAPLIVWGCDNPEKDVEVFSLIAEKFSGRNLLLAPVEEVNYRQLSAAAKKYCHTLVATSPIDINLAKQLNILLQNQGVGKIIIDPTTGGLGYGLEYTYSVMERMRIAALCNGDSTLAMPIICNLGREIWKSKEAQQPGQEGIMMEVSAAVSLLLAGADMLVLRHPQSLAMVQSFIDDMYQPSRLEQGVC